MGIYLIIRVCANRKNLDTPLEFLVFRSPILDAPSSSEMGTEWTRLSVTFKADVPQDGFWPNPHYLLQFEGGCWLGRFHLFSLKG